jgi:hypothetical protein
MKFSREIAVPASATREAMALTARTDTDRDPLFPDVQQRSVRNPHLRTHGSSSVLR